MLTAAVIVAIIVGAGSIASACYHWVRQQVFGTPGIVLSTIGILLLGGAVWASVEAGKRSDSTSIQRIIDDGNTKTIAAVKESNKQLADQLQQFSKRLQDNQDRTLSEMQKHILAIRTALTERSAPTQQPPQTQQPPSNAAAGSAATPKKQPAKTR
jgi:hypothetical protein